MAKRSAPILDTDDAESTAFENTSSVKRLKRSPTNSSYFDFDQVPWDGKHGRSWMHAWRVQRQQIGLTLNRIRSAIDSKCKYPSYFGNKEGLPLKTKSEPIFDPRENKATDGWLHHPLIPNSINTFLGHKAQCGAVRSVYAPSDPTIFDVIYHVKTAGSREGEFRLATYHPAVNVK